MVDLTSREYDALRAGYLRIDCRRMELTCRGAATPTYHGAGVITVGDGTDLNFELYDPHYDGGTEALDRIFNVQAGQWLPEDHFYNLSVIDFGGREWHAEWLDADPTTHLGAPGALVRGSIRTLTATDRGVGKQHHLFMRIPGRLEIPINSATTTETTAGDRKSHKFSRNLWIHDDPSKEFRFRKTDRSLEIDISSSHPLPRGYDTRVEEALWFVIGRPVQWQMLRESGPDSSRLVLRAAPSEPLKPRLNPPLSVHDDPLGESLGKMFSAYLGRVIEYEEERYHPLSVVVRSVLRSSASSIQDEALALGVAVESLLREYFSAEGAADAESVCHADAAQKHLEAWNGPNSIKDRVRTCIGYIKGPTPRTALRFFESRGVLRQYHRVAWEELRNTATHGLLRSDDLHRLVELCDTVHQLFCLLVFKVIDYSGPFTDYRVPGYPTAVAPLPTQ